MKQLIIFRHGKAEQDTMAKDDYDRALTERGRRNASDMGAFILKKTGVPDLILTSSAKRAHETAILAAKAMDYPEAEIQTDQNLYFAPERWIMNVLSKLPDNIDSCIFVGHNPGLTDLINSLGVQLDNLPTASTACFEFNADSWKEISTDQANFKWLKVAKEL
ncbi:MAG: histidine phosphatase family protein [Fermentimonas sp.]|jgi:phosphohistidine phosphatase|nr:histidine phosphatase family protein [Fermentimonas sp.]NLC86739.1 histidine phosphatase family protein [Bacteroidales bacterium]HBT86689.1 phosphohistidine phosphatase [Porphyromonadaceae bacterium]MDD2930815.1 histidine phosphatase family protein [Fermentimonas sp.]MDD3189413.1 histidine phosphatase family protein [Fermentimonas sp.]